MRRYVVNGCILSKWTNQFLSYAEDAVGRELDEDEVMAVLDYAIGFISDSKYKDCAEQAAEFVGLIEFDDDYLFEMLILESFQAGLNWETILKKRKYFKIAYDDFNVKKVSLYNDLKIKELMSNKNIIRNKLKIESSINNAKIFIKIKEEWGSFSNYIWHFTNGKIVYGCMQTENELSKIISQDLKLRGMKFVGSVIIYSYLQAIGIINDHEKTWIITLSVTGIDGLWASRI